MNYKPLSRPEIAKILKRSHGAKAEVARRAAVSHTAVSHWLKGRTISANVASNAEAVAREILAKEQAAKDAAGLVNGQSVRSLLTKIKRSGAADGGSTD